MNITACITCCVVVNYWHENDYVVVNGKTCLQSEYEWHYLNGRITSNCDV